MLALANRISGTKSQLSRPVVLQTTLPTYGQTTLSHYSLDRSLGLQEVHALEGTKVIVLYFPQDTPGADFCYRLSPPQRGRDLVNEKSNQPTGNRTRNLPACSTVPRPTVPMCTPTLRNTYKILYLKCQSQSTSANSHATVHHCGVSRVVQTDGCQLACCRQPILRATLRLWPRPACPCKTLGQSLSTDDAALLQSSAFASYYTNKFITAQYQPFKHQVK